LANIPEKSHGQVLKSSALIGGCYSMGEVPGRSVVKALGLVEFTQKGIAGDAPKVSPSIFRSLLDAASTACKAD